MRQTKTNQNDVSPEASLELPDFLSSPHPRDELTTMYCQKCRTPLKLDGSVESLNPAAFDLLSSKFTHRAIVPIPLIKLRSRLYRQDVVRYRSCLLISAIILSTRTPRQV